MIRAWNWPWILCSKSKHKSKCFIRNLFNVFCTKIQAKVNVKNIKPRAVWPLYCTHAVWPL